MILRERWKRSASCFADHGWGAQPAPVRSTRLLLAQGDAAAAARWTQETALHAGDEPCYPREPDTWYWPGCCWTRAARRGALALDRLHAAAVAQHRVGSVIEAGALRALALAACWPGRGERPRRRAHAGLPAGYVRVFCHEGYRWPRC